jgi:hypothetical protein
MGEDALGDGSQWPTLNMSLLLEQGRRRHRIDPFAFHQDPTGLLHPGVMLHGKRQLRREPLLLAGAGQLQGGHDQPGKGAAGGNILGLPGLRVSPGQVERADGAVALAHRHAQPRPQAGRLCLLRNAGQRRSEARSPLATG